VSNGRINVRGVGPDVVPRQFMQVVKWILVTGIVTGVLAARCGAQPVQVELGWIAPSSGAVTGYYLSWMDEDGSESGGTNVPSGTNSDCFATITLTNASPGDVYYFDVQTCDATTLSAFANEVAFTNGVLATNSPIGSTNIVLNTNGPPTPPGGSGTNIGTNNGTNVAGSSQPTNNTVTQSLIWGIPPAVNLAMSNGTANLSVAGTVGATLVIESTTNIFSMDDWNEVTNVTITNIAPVVPTNPPPQTPDALDLAFVPGLQTFTVQSTNSATQYYRAVMQYDYVVLASMVLTNKNCTPRLILVNMPGVVCDDVCYVNESSSFIHVDRGNYALDLEASSSTIRAIADQLATTLNLNWTSASEFSYSNGLCQILATVVETEPPSSDPVAGQSPPGPPIVINF
jgi:hypothetical protein